MTLPSPEELNATIEGALNERLEGNELLKAGDYKGALRKYYSVLLKLKGLESTVTSVFGAAPKDPNNADATYLASTAPTTPLEKIKNAIYLVYINSAVIHIKQEKYKRALDCALDAQKLDEKSSKAKFREAQARIGLGEISKGKAMLEDLNKAQPDSAIVAALNQLKLDEKARSAKSNTQFKGMYSKKSTTTTSEKTEATTSSKPVGAKFTELTEEEAKKDEEEKKEEGGAKEEEKKESA